MEFGEFWQRFTLAEQRGEAFKFELLDAKLWPVFRTRIFYRLAQELEIFQDPHPAQSNPDSAMADVGEFPHLVNCENVVVPFRRRVDGEDPYTADLISELRKSGREFTVLDFYDPSQPIDIKRIRAWGLAQFEQGMAEEFRSWRQQQLRRWQGWRPRLTTPKHYEQRWQLIVASLEAEFGAHLGDFHDLPRWRLRRFFAQARSFQRYLAGRAVKRLFLVNAYSNPDLVFGAKLAGAKVVELQHGFISPLHPAYSFPAHTKSEVLADELLVWGEHWKREARMPRGTRIRVAGPTSQFLSSRATIRPQPDAQTCEILFTSQGALADQLFAVALDFAHALPDFQITYRLHPNESIEDYRSRQQQTPPSNLKLSDKVPKFLDLLSEGPIVVGGFSTTLYEAAGIGLPAIALQLPGYEHLEGAVAAGDIQLLSTRELDAEAIRQAVARAKPAKYPHRYYAQFRAPYF